MNLFELPLRLAPAALLAFSLNAQAAPANDAEILDVVKTANQAEISAAELAATKATSPKVREFANHMIKEHSSNNKDNAKVSDKTKITPSVNVDSTSLKADADNKLATLQKEPANSPTFDKTYMEQQVTMHQALLDDLNHNLIPAAKNADVKNYLQQTKKHVQNHLTEARKIQGEL